MKLPSLSKSMMAALTTSALLVPFAALAEPPSASKPPSAQAPAAADKKICHTITRLGSILPQHVCGTREEWKEVVRVHEGDGDILAFSQHPNAPTGAQQAGSTP
jgi:hypothetical protein